MFKIEDFNWFFTKRNVAKKCLLNSPVSTFAITSATYQYPGQFYTLPQQCKLAIGSYSTSVGCNV